jgi:hypothetical protein
MAQRPRSPRMRRLASHLSVIRISLNPPSPPPPMYEEQSPSPSFTLAVPAPWLQDHPIENSRLLQVPRGDQLCDEVPRQCSPPPRRCSYASTLSENSSLSLNTSYQNLLSPFPVTNNNASRSSTHSYSDDNETPPNEFLYIISRPYSGQVSRSRRQDSALC